MIKRLAVAVIAALAIWFSVAADDAEAKPSCDGSWSMGVGGIQLSAQAGFWEDSRYIQADQPVGYDSLNPQAGLAELDRLYWRHRASCPRDWVKIVGHSEGAGVVHAWVTANRSAELVSAVLLADPKQLPAGLASHPLGVLVGYPLAGVDATFGTVPVLQVCNVADVVCNRPAGWGGYLLAQAHTSYLMRADAYPAGISGVWMR